MSRAARTLWLVFVFDAVLLTAVLQAWGVPANDTIVRPVRRFLAAVQQTDSWRPMQIAERYVAAPHVRPVYDELLEARGVKFQYPLSSLLFTRHLSLSWLNTISWFSIVVVIVAVWRILRSTGTGTPLEFGRRDPTVGLALVGLTLSFYPIMEAYSLGQIQAWINALLALAVLAWVARYEHWAGVAIGLAVLLKPTYALLGVWGVVRRQYSFVTPMAAVVALGTLASIIAYGVADNVNYLSALSTIGKHGEVFHANQSFNGFLNRFFVTGDSLTFDRWHFAPFHPVVYGGTVAAFVILMGLALWLPARWRQAGTVADLSVVLLTITAAAPVAWTHHYGVVLPVMVAVVPTLLSARPFGRAATVALAVCYIALSQSFPPSSWLAETTGNVVQSYVLAGALLLLAMLYRWFELAARSAPVTALPTRIQEVAH